MMRPRLLLLAAIFLLALPPAYLRWRYMSWDTCDWLRYKATVIAREEAGHSIYELPDSDPRFDWEFARWMQLTQRYHDSGRCLEGWARLRLVGAPPVVR